MFGNLVVGRCDGCWARQASMYDTSADTAAKTRSQSQKPPHKDLEPKWLKPSHLGSRPLMFRFLSAPVRALKKCTPRLLEGCGHGTTLCFTLP
ncbi:hypothetical protein EFO80_05260 [Lacticaseibacillus rhamnosus]|nr:hypothetical protein [Lacticaseibacillus rhamnosus]MCT3178133.1 hypothetical protein [Lacticaseibacillus rhamnosus]MCT4447851.1 hypothetical protein [Lacticaseibacillus rhamnosus]